MEKKDDLMFKSILVLEFKFRYAISVATHALHLAQPEHSAQILAQTWNECWKDFCLTYPDIDEKVLQDFRDSLKQDFPDLRFESEED